VLSDVKLRAAKPVERDQKLYDERGLYLLIKPNGSRWWRFKYRFNGKEQLLSFGVHPEVTLAQARDARDEARALLRDGKNPAVERKAEKQRSLISSANTFEAIAREWLAMQEKKLTASTMGKARWMLESFVYPKIGALPVAGIESPDVLSLLRAIEQNGTHETAHRTRARCSQVFRYAIATGRAKHDPTRDLRGALAPVASKSRAAITDPQLIGALLRSLDSYAGYAPTQAALKLAPLVFVRPGELRAAEWDEFDLDAAEWRIQASRMKMRETHVVPLATQAVAILRDLKPHTGNGRFLFPSLRSRARPMSNNTINAALRRLGYDAETMTGHGFRALASTRLNEMGWAPDVIERQLAHAERNKVRAAYNRAQYMAERRTMMQAWANYLDEIKAGGTVVPIRKKSGASR